MKKHISRFLEAVLFCVLLSGVLVGISSVVERKASIVRFQPFFDHAQEFDVLFMGDSHMVNAVFPMELWKEYGIASYNVSSYGNTTPVSYWALVNALDYASPELVVIDIKDVNRNLKLTGSSSDVHTAFDCYPLSLNKIRAIEDLMDDPEAMDDSGNRYTEMKWEYYFTLGKYHSRWSEISISDFTITPTKMAGSDMAVGVAVPEEYEIIDQNRALDAYGWGFDYLRRMIAECQGRGIDVLLTHLPYPCSMDDQMAANTVDGIAQEYGVEFIDFVNLDQVVDYHTDLYDADSHLNPSGARKVTDYLGRYMVDHYGIADRRDEAAYAHWHVMYDEYANHKKNLVIGARDSLAKLLMLAHDGQFSVDLAIRDQANAYWDDQLLTLMHNMAREHIFEKDAYSKWSDGLLPLIGLEEAVWSDEAYYLSLNRASGVMNEHTGEDAHRQAGEAFGREIWQQDKEIRIRVRDCRTGSILVDQQF